MTPYPFPREAGLLLHPTSLPGKEGIGTLGREARDFIDFCADASVSVWQMCPLGPTGFGDSPYQCLSAFAGNPLLIDLVDLCERGWLEASTLPTQGKRKRGTVDFGNVIPFKERALRTAFEHFCRRAEKSDRADFEEFRMREASWLDDWSLFAALKRENNLEAWTQWPESSRFRTEKSLQDSRTRLDREISFHSFTQWIFQRQWTSLRDYAASRSVKIMGDMPIFVASDSCDVWAHPGDFQLDREGKPVIVAGVPPDYFSPDGQLWGNPVYDWDAMAGDGYAWWSTLIRHQLTRFDYLRIDHFRGFSSYWAVPAGSTTARNGEWRPGPGSALFRAVESTLGTLPVIAEDLGLITAEVKQLIAACGFPGMKILQFAFDSAEGGEHLPHNSVPATVLYTGTHDNDTLKGWFSSAPKADRRYALSYLGNTEREIPWRFIRCAYASPSRLAVIPVQDLLCLGKEARMNTPGTRSGNWIWRLEGKELSGRRGKKIAGHLRTLAALFGRSLRR